jgi:hypothetical protein
LSFLVVFLLHADSRSCCCCCHCCCCCPQVVCGTMGLPTCTVQLKGPDSITRVAVGVGTGEGGASAV